MLEIIHIVLPSLSSSVCWNSMANLESFKSYFNLIDAEKVLQAFTPSTHLACVHRFAYLIGQLRPHFSMLMLHR